MVVDLWTHYLELENRMRQQARSGRRCGGEESDWIERLRGRPHVIV